MRFLIAVVFSLVTFLGLPVAVQAESVESLLDEGEEAYLYEDDDEKAERIFRQVLKIEPNNAAAFAGLGWVLWLQSQYEEAEAAYREAIRIDSNDDEYHVELGLTLEYQDRYEEAEAAYREAIRIAPDSRYNYDKLGDLLEEQDRYEEAEAAYREAIRLDPDYVWSYDSLGSVLENQERYEEAERVYREAIDLAPDRDRNYTRLGDSLDGQGRYEEAEAAYREAISLDPSKHFNHSWLGNFLRQQGRYEEAEGAYREAIRLDPDYELNKYTYFYLGDTLREQELYEEAEGAYREALNLGMSIGSYSYRIGYLYQVQGRLEEAITSYLKALEIDPNYTAARNNLAEAERLRLLGTNRLPTFSDDLAWQPEDEPLQPILRSVVRVVTKTSSGIKYGTGWVVKRDNNQTWVLTNRHVVTEATSDLEREEPATLSKSSPLSDEISIDLFSEPPEGRTALRLEAQVIETTSPTAELDLALLVIENAPEDIRPLVLAEQSVGLNTDVNIIGHHNDPWTLARGYVSNRPRGAYLQLAETTIGKGSSGSPILNSENEVVGIVVSIEPPNIGNGSDFLGGFSYGHPANVLLEALREWNIL